MDSKETIAALEAPDALTNVPPLLDAGKLDANAILGFRGTPLTVALRNSDVALARLLLKHGADPWASNLDDPPLVVAARYCPADATELILAQAQPLAANAEEVVATLRDRALYAASGWCRTGAIRSLLTHGADPNSLPHAPEGFDPRATPQTNTETTSKPMNPHVNYQDQATWGTGTALHVVARAKPHDRSVMDKLRGIKTLWTEQDQIECVQLMLSHGAERALRDEMGRTAGEVAELANASKEVVRILREGDAK